MVDYMAVRFPLGRVVATPGALSVLRLAAVHPSTLLARHQTGDWGDLSAEDVRANNVALNPHEPGRLLSSYNITATDTLWIITEWDRSVTTILLPSEY